MSLFPRTDQDLRTIAPIVLQRTVSEDSAWLIVLKTIPTVTEMELPRIKPRCIETKGDEKNAQSKRKPNYSPRQIVAIRRILKVRNNIGRRFERSPVEKGFALVEWDIREVRVWHCSIKKRRCIIERRVILMWLDDLEKTNSLLGKTGWEDMIIVVHAKGEAKKLIRRTNRGQVIMLSWSCIVGWKVPICLATATVLHLPTVCR